MTIADQLTSINNTKAAIKSAIESKGVTVGSVAFDQYPSKIAAISGGTGPEPVPDWVRPADWLAMPTFTPGEQKIAGLLPIFDNASNAVSMTIAGAYIVNWGDGNIENFSSGATASHTYTYAAIDSGTTSTRGYKQVMVTVTPQAGNNFTSVDLSVTPTAQTSGTSGANKLINWLDLIISVPQMSNQSNLKLGPISTTVHWPYCERVNIRETHANGINPQYMFNNFYALQELTTAFKLSTAANCSSMFYNCKSLKKLPNFDFSAISSSGSAAGMFFGCSSLIEIPNTFVGSQLTGYMIQNMFSGCASLKKIPTSLAGAKPSNTSNTFNGCCLITEIPALDTSAIIDATSMFQNCYSLTSITISLPICSIGTSIFNGCNSLREVTINDASVLSNISSAFANCTSLKKVNSFNCSGVSNVSSIFSGCTSLVETPALNWSSVTTITTPFNNCSNLAKIPITFPSVTFTVANCRLSATELNAIYTGLPSATSKTITVSNNWGAASDDPTIATAKGWTVAGS